jgi:integrase
MKVSIRKKKLKGDKSSLYLDITSEGQRRKEYLKLVIFEKPRNEMERKQNKYNMELAKAVQAKKLVELMEGHFGFTRQKKKKVKFMDYFKEAIERRKNNDGNYGNWNSAYKHLQAFSKSDVHLDEVDEKWLSEFKFYLQHLAKKGNGNKLSTNSASSYYNKIVATMRQAYTENDIQRNPSDKIDRIKQEETQREFLTLEELKKLAKQPFELKDLKRAALFSCLTGLRWSDIEKLKWKDILFSEELGHYMRFKQQKTKGAETKYLPQQAIQLMGERGAPEQKVFRYLSYSDYNNSKLRDWVNAAGIDKYITFHCFRHTYATIQLTLGTDIYVLSKELGHKDLRTTEIYAKIVDQRKREAANKIPDLGIEV